MLNGTWSLPAGTGPLNGHGASYRQDKAVADAISPASGRLKALRATFAGSWTAGGRGSGLESFTDRRAHISDWINVGSGRGRLLPLRLTKWSAHIMLQELYGRGAGAGVVLATANTRRTGTNDRNAQSPARERTGF